MTTLVEELEQAAKRSDWLAFQCTPQAVGDVRSKELRAAHEAEARRLRQRAAWVREYVAAFATAEGGYSEAVRGALRQLAGPIPSETAPASPKEGTGEP